MKQITYICSYDKRLLPLLFLCCDTIRKEGRTLLFIDEIQQSPHTVSLLRYFYEELPEIYVIAAGSLLGTMLENHLSFLCRPHTINR